jgi:hypothetical protein
MLDASSPSVSSGAPLRQARVRLCQNTLTGFVIRWMFQIKVEECIRGAAYIAQGPEEGRIP